MFCPIHDGFVNQLKAHMFGPDTDLTDDPDKIAHAEGREITTVTSVGILKVVFQISQRNFGRFGYKTI
jgi:hypothetical protein